MHGRKTGRQDVELSRQVFQLSNIGVDLNARKPRTQHQLRRLPPLAQELSLNQAAKCALESQLDAADSGEQSRYSCITSHALRRSGGCPEDVGLSCNDRGTTLRRTDEGVGIVSAKPWDDWSATHHPCGAPYGTMDQRQCKEQFSLAFAHAIVTGARCSISDPRVDDERVDFTVRQKASHILYDASAIDIQMKCTSQDVIRPDGLHWTLKGDHYNDLANARVFQPKILVILHVPLLPGAWIDHPTTGPLSLKNRAYWMSLRGHASTSQDSKTVVLPAANAFNVEQLLGMLKRVGGGGQP